MVAFAKQINLFDNYYIKLSTESEVYPLPKRGRIP